MYVHTIRESEIIGFYSVLAQKGYICHAHTINHQTYGQNCERASIHFNHQTDQYLS